MSGEPASQPAATAPVLASGSVFARGGLVFYAFLITYASWYPFSGWRSNGLPLSAFLFAPLPYYWTKFDLLTNIVGYMPFGVLLVFSLYPRLRGVWAVLLASMIGALVSTAMEAGQNFLPSRVPSNLDLLTNAAGVVLGALAGALLTPAFLEQSRMLALRSRWFLHEASRGLIVLALWPLAQVYPQAYLFGHGPLLPMLSDWLSALWSTQIDLGALLRRDVELSAEQYCLRPYRRGADAAVPVPAAGAADGAGAGPGRCRAGGEVAGQRAAVLAGQRLCLGHAGSRRRPGDRHDHAGRPVGGAAGCATPRRRAGADHQPGDRQRRACQPVFPVHAANLGAGPLSEL
jgi:VanZ family protein